MLISSRCVNKHGRYRQSLFLVGQFLKKSSPLKPLGQMNWNLIGSNYGRSSIKIAHFAPIYNQHMQFLFLVCRFMKIFSSETTFPNKAKFYRKYIWKFLYKISLFRTDWTKTWSPWAILVSDSLKFKKNLLLWN